MDMDQFTFLEVYLENIPMQPGNGSGSMSSHPKTSPVIIVPVLSGATIFTALYQNVNPERAANFSFLMLLPVVLGATLIKALELFELGIQAEWVPILLGTLVAYASGIAAIKILLSVIRRGRLQYFAIYCFLVGGIGLWLIQA